MKRAAILSILFITIILLLTAGCGKQADDSAQSTDDSISEKISKKDLKQFDEEVQELLTRNDNYKQPAPSSFANIQKALDAGDITKEEWAILTLKAAFDKDNLPDEYKGEDPEVLGDGILMEVEWWMHENWDNLDEDTKEALEPFYLTPDNPKSFYHPSHTKSKRAELMKSLELIPSVEAVELEAIDFILSTNPRKVVFINYDKNNPAMKQRAIWANESLTKAWPMFENLFGKFPDQSIFMYITNTGGFWGSASMRHLANKDRCYVKVTDKENEKITKATTSHELFHCFQYYIPIKYSKIPRMWMMEATATYSEHWVWPEYNTEWRVLHGFFNLLDEDMVQWDRFREYTRYTWYYYLMQTTGNLGKIKKDLNDVKTKDGRLVVKDTPNFGDLYADFARWNWNQDPEYRYSDTPSFPTGSYKGKPMYPNGKSYKGKIINTKQELSQEVPTMDPLSMAYRAYAFTDNIDKVVFKFDEEGDDLHQRQALIKIGDVWHWEDWTELKERKFCRTRDDEKVLAVVLIVSNADHDQSHFYKLKYKVDSKSKCNPEWRGSTTWMWSHGWGWQILYASHSLSQSSMMTSHDTLIYDEDEDEFYIKDQMVSYRYYDKHSVGFAQNCGMLYEFKSYKLIGSTHKTWDIDPDYPSLSDAPTRMSVDYDDPMLYNIDINTHPYDMDWINTISYDSSQRRACPLEGITTPGPGSYIKSTSYPGRTSSFKYKPNDIQLQISDDGTKIQGTKTEQMGSGNERWQATIMVNYQYG
ncbi:hypothetical protein ACFL3V_05075 [Nanoarchaeota archaeon]